MREVVLDTETTGLNPADGHRIVEIGVVEIANLIPTGRSFHVYLDPERDMPDEAFRVHGLSSEFLSTQKKFAEIAEEFRAFIDGARLIIHNAEFDVRFLNAELARLERAADRLGQCPGHAGAGASAPSRNGQFARRALPALWRRHVAAREAWGAAERSAARRGLCGADGRTSGLAPAHRRAQKFYARELGFYAKDPRPCRAA